jgi:hypothetical protein
MPADLPVRRDSRHFLKGLAMKKFLAIVLALTMVAPVTLGCGDKKKDTKKTTTTVETEKNGKDTKVTEESKKSVEEDK